MTEPITGIQSDADDSGAQGGTGTGEPASGDSGAQGGADTTTATPPVETVPRSVMEQVKNQLRAADQKREAAEAALRQLRDKDLPEAEKVKRDYEELKAQNEKLQRDLREQAIDTAFRDVTGYAWHDPAAARTLLDLTGVEIGDDRTVTGMKDAVKRLATANPWLLKPADASADSDAPGAGSGTGAPPMNGRPGTKNEPDKSKLAQRFPALRSRGV